MKNIKEKNFISTVVYVYNNQSTIEKFMIDLYNVLNSIFENYEIILVNDNSTDGTNGKIKTIIDKINCKVTVINLSRKHGNELAMLAGTDKAIGDYIIEIDSPENDYNIEIIKRLYDKSQEGYDIVSGSPDGKLDITSKMFYKFLNKISYLNMELTTENIRIVSRRALNIVLNIKEKVRYRKALYAYCGLPRANIFYKPISNKKTNKGSFVERVNLAFDVIANFSQIGLSVAFSFSMVFFAISICIGIYALIIKITLKSVVSGWTTLMLFMSLGFSGIFFVLGIISKYINIILFETQNSPNYSVRSIDMYSNDALPQDSYKEVAASKLVNNNK